VIDFSKVAVKVLFPPMEKLENIFLVSSVKSIIGSSIPSVV
jgi:hypothetical protein